MPGYFYIIQKVKFNASIDLSNLIKGRDRLSYQEWFSKIELRFQNARKQGIQLTADVIGQTLCEDDFYIMSIMDKCIRLIDGFLLMLESRNLTCAGVLLRIQIDNCLRTYALYAAENQSEVFQSVISGDKHINRMMAKDGNRMTDAYLRKQLAKIDKRFDSVYKAASGYVHHSEKAFFSIVSTKEPYVLNFNVGHPISIELDSVLHECAEAFLYFVKFQYEITRPFVESKKRIDG